MLSNLAIAVLYVLLGLLFSMISIGAAMGCRAEGCQAWTLALIFGVFAAYSFINAVGFVRRKQERDTEASR